MCLEQPHTDEGTIQGSEAQPATWTNLITIKNKQKSCRRGFLSLHLLQKGRKKKHHSASGIECRQVVQDFDPMSFQAHHKPGCRAPAALALGLTGAEFARAVRLRKDAVMQQNAVHGPRSDSAKLHWSTHRIWGAEQGLSEGKHIPCSPEVLGLQSQISFLSA